MSNVNLDYMLRQAQANVNANKNNAAHQAQVQAQAKAAQERQAYVEEHKNTYKPPLTPVLPTQPKQELQQDFADLTIEQKLNALMRDGKQPPPPPPQSTKYYTVGTELQHDDIDPHWTTYKPVLPSNSLLPYKPTKKLTSADIATPLKPTAQQKFDDAVNRGILIADATPKKAIANFETLWNTAGNQLGKGITLQTQKQELESRLLPQNTKEPSQTLEELKETYKSTPETTLPVNEKTQTPHVLTYGEAMQKQADENLAKAKEGLGEGGQMAVDLASSLSDMAFGMGTAGALGISSAIPIFAAQSAADGIEEAKANGATEEEAFAYGVLKGGLTAVTEKLVAGIPMTGKSILSSIKPVDDAITKVTAKIAKSPTGAALIKRAFDVLGEGVEGVLETAVTPFLQRMTYNPDAELASKEELLYSAVMEALASAVFNVPGAVADTVNATKTALPNANAAANAQTEAEANVQAQPVQDEILPRANVQSNAQTAPIMDAQTEAETETDAETETGFMGPEVDAESDSNRDFTTNNGKVGSYLTNAINEESKVIGKALGVPYSRRGDFAKDRLRALANSFMRTGEFDAEAALSIFDDAWEQGQLENREYYDAYKDVKDALQKTKVQLTDEVKANIPDFQQWQKYNRFRIGMTNEGGVPIDQKYQELSMQYPNLFPESITDLSEQLMKMAEVSGEIHVAQQSLSEIYGDQTGENYRAMRKSFAERMQDFEKRLKQARDVQVETDTKNASTIETPTLDFAKQAYQTAKQAKREYEKALARSSVLLTDLQKRQVQAIAAGKLTAEEIPESAAKKTMMELAEIRKRELEAMAPVKAYKEQYRNGLRNTAAKLLEGSYLWKDKSMGLQYSRETMERNVRDMVKDKAQADAIISEYFTPVHKQEAARTRFKNEMRDKVRAMDLNEVESYAVQFLGEKRAEIADLEEQKLDIRKMRKLNEMRSEVNQFLKSNADKIDLPKVERAIEEFHAIYDDLFRQMNDVRIKNGYDPVDYRKNYFPHFLDNKPDTLIGKLGAALGIEIDVKELPVDIAGRTHTFRPGIQWFGNTLQRQGTNTGYDAVRGFDKYIEGVSNVIYHTDNIQKLRALSNEIRYEGTDAAMQEMIDKIRADENMSDYEKNARIKDIYEEQPTKLSKFVQELEEYTNILAGKKSRRDRNAEGNIGRKLYSVAQNLNNRVAANMVALNPGSWITNFAPIVQTATQTNPATMARAIKDTVRSYASDDGFANESTFLTNRRGSNPLVVDTLDKLSGALSKPMEWIDHFTSDAVTRARYYDNMNKGMSHADALDEADSYAAGLIGDRSKGALPTIFEAKNPLAKLFTAFQVEVNNQLSWMFKDLPQDERNKSVAMTAWKLLSLFVGSYLANDVYEKLRGSRVLFDPMSMVNDAVGDITGYQLPNLVDLAQNATKGDEALPFKEMAETDKTGVSNAINTAAGSAAAELPFIGGLLEGGRLPISSAIPDASQLVKLFDPEVSAEKKWNIAGKELLGKPVAYMAPPFGGGQIKKTVEGLKAVNEGGSYTIDNDGNRTLQYPVFKENDKSDILPYAQAAVFGKSSLPTAKDWVDSGFKTKNVKFTQAYDYLAEQGVNTKSAYDFLEAFNAIESTDDESSTEQKRAMLLADETMTPEQKAKIDDILLGSKWDDVKKSTQTAIVNARVDDTTTDADKENLKKAAAAALDRIEQVRGNTEEETLQLRREALERENTLSDEQKDIVRYKLLDGPVSYESAIEHRRSTDSYQNKAKIAAFGETGGSVDDFYSVYDRFKKVKKNDEETAIEQKRAMLLADDTLSPEQKTKLDELLLNSKKPVSYESEAEHRRSLATESQQEKIAGFESIGGTVDAYYKAYDAFKSAEGDSALPTAQKKKNVYNALPTKYQRIVDETPKNENLNALKSYLLQSMSGLTNKEKQYLDSALIGNDIMPMERTVTYGNDSAYALSALGESWVEKYNELASPAKIDADTFVKAYYAAASATWAKGENGAKSKAIKAAIDAVTPGMTKEQRRKLYEANGVGKTYW